MAVEKLADHLHENPFKEMPHIHLHVLISEEVAQMAKERPPAPLPAPYGSYLNRTVAEE